MKNVKILDELLLQYLEEKFTVISNLNLYTVQILYQRTKVGSLGFKIFNYIKKYIVPNLLVKVSLIDIHKQKNNI